VSADTRAQAQTLFWSPDFSGHCGWYSDGGANMTMYSFVAFASVGIASWLWMVWFLAFRTMSKKEKGK
jgi:hypothetical protein